MTDALEPVSQSAEEEEGGPKPGIGIGVSGGGYRAMLFHLGAFLRLFELGLLKKLDRISSVSGGSITSAKIGLEWEKLNTRDDFMTHVVAPIRGLAGVTIDVPSVLWGLILPGGVGKRIANRYRKHLFGDATLQDLPDGIRFVINATNLETGKLWRFSKPYMRDYLVGKVANPKVSLADAVAASSAFPPVLSPFLLEVDPASFTEVQPGVTPDMLARISMSDGGVYDNLGLETVWKRLETVLVSDAGAATKLDPDPKGDWGRLGLRVVNIIFGQVASLRTRQVIASFDAGDRTGAYWGIRSDIANYKLADALPAPFARTSELAATPTRLAKLEPLYQERLINWGYAVCDAAVRRHFRPDAPKPAGYPYPASGV
ncbi:MAG TPA: patatin-like phospholipase family protein [Allosphingosinicella sp.]|nr:patatin-like phospholipase family protein [Allosphingosinicella sp.]